MITIDILCRSVSGLQPDQVEQWIGNAWLHAEGTQGHRQFHAIDAARVRLIHELRHDLGIDDETLPVVLSLMDQLYAARRQMHALRRAIEQTAPGEVREAILDVLERKQGQGSALDPQGVGGPLDPIL